MVGGYLTVGLCQVRVFSSGCRVTWRVYIIYRAQTGWAELGWAGLAGLAGLGWIGDYKGKKKQSSR